VDLKTVTYTSRAQLDLLDEDLSEIHDKARHFNALNGITGILIYDGVRFLQIVEGPEEAIDELTDRLRLDRRHSAFEVRDERLVVQRSFPAWSMELVRVSEHSGKAVLEVASMLPADTTTAIYELAVRMTHGLSSASAHG
jgi:hypothetical protein